jgi:hypothetical protein
MIIKKQRLQTLKEIMVNTYDLLQPLSVPELNNVCQDYALYLDGRLAT